MAGTSHDLVLDSDVHQLGTRVRDTDAHGYVARCLHSLPRWTCKFAMDDGSQVQPVAMAAFVGEEVTSNACRRRSAAGTQTSRTCLLAQLALAEPASLLWMTVLKCNQLQWQLLLERKSPATHAARRRNAAGAQTSRTCLLAQLALADAASLPWWFWSATNCCGSFCWRGRC